MFTSIIVAIDGSKQSSEALAAAISLAGLTGGHLCLITVPQPIIVPVIDGTMSYPMPYSQDDLDRDAKATLDAALSSVPDGLKTRTVTNILYGDPAHCIVEKATEIGADLIVLGRRGLGTFTGLLLGSTTTKVGQLAPCAVLTVK